MAILTTGSYPSDLEPIGRQWFMDTEKLLDPIYPKLFDVRSTKRKFEHLSIFGGLGLAALKDEASNIQYDSMVEGPEKVFTQATYGLGFQISDEMVAFGQAGIAMKNRSSELAKSLMEKKEELLADIFDNAFTGGATGADGSQLCVTDHAIQDGKTIRNELTTAADLSEASLEQMIIDIKDEMKDYRGKRAVIRVKEIVYPTELQFEAHRILRSNLRVATADNDANALREAGAISGQIQHDRLDDADAYFLRLDCKDGLIVYQSKNPEFSSDNSFDNMVMKFKGVERYASGWGDYRCLFGTPGAA